MTNNEIKEMYFQHPEKLITRSAVSVDEAIMNVLAYIPDTDTRKFIIAALQKQKAMGKHKYMGYRCICGEEVAKNQDYCEYCGQRLLKWEDSGVE